MNFSSETMKSMKVGQKFSVVERKDQPRILFPSRKKGNKNILNSRNTKEFISRKHN